MAYHRVYNHWQGIELSHCHTIATIGAHTISTGNQALNQNKRRTYHGFEIYEGKPRLPDGT